jgi:DNA-binding NarL/FixJ family response regulator
MIRVVIADDAVLLRASLRYVLEREGIEVAAEAGDPTELIDAVDRHRPEAAVVDIRMPPTFTVEGVRAARALRTRYPGLGVLLLSQHLEQREVRPVLEQRGGGVGYLLKDRISDIAGFVTAVRAVAAGDTTIDVLVVDALLRRARAVVGVDALSTREREILARMASGRSNAGIAADFQLTERTVEAHVRAIFAKLALVEESDVNRRVMAVLSYLGR